MFFYNAERFTRMVIEMRKASRLRWPWPSDVNEWTDEPDDGGVDDGYGDGIEEPCG